MNRTEPHPIEVLLVACWLAVEAACHLLAALVALALALVPTAAAGGTARTGGTGQMAGTPRRPGPAARNTSPQQEEPISPVRGMPPAPHPLAVLAEQLVADCTRRQLQALAGTRANLSKAQLAGMVAACS